MFLSLGLNRDGCKIELNMIMAIKKRACFSYGICACTDVSVKSEFNKGNRSKRKRPFCAGEY